MTDEAVMDGAVGILTGKGPACDELGEWLDGLPETVQVYRKGWSNQVAQLRNRIAEEVVARDLPWVLFVDNDVVPQRGALQALLATGLPLVSAVVLQRTYPHPVCAVKSFEPFERWEARGVLAQRAPFPVPAIGTGCLLVRRAAFEAMAFPWFRCGQLNPELLTEDTDFSLRAAEAGFVPHLHPRVLAGHAIDPPVVWPGADGPLAQWVDAEGRTPWRQPMWLAEEPSALELGAAARFVAAEVMTGSRP